MLCCKSHTHAANMKFQPNACFSCFKQYFPFLLGGENVHNYFINSLPVLIILLHPLPVLVALKTLRDILSFTRSFMINTGSPTRWVSRKLRPKSKTILCYTADCFKSSCLLFVDTMCLALQRDSRFVLQNCHATDIALRILKKLWCYVSGSITR